MIDLSTPEPPLDPPESTEPEGYWWYGEFIEADRPGEKEEWE